MFRPVRTLISFVCLSAVLWVAFRVPLGPRTLAEHIDRIGQTSEAKDLVHGARSTVAPLVDEVTDRVLGEYVEAPTDPAAQPGDARPSDDILPTRASTPTAPRLPGGN